MDKINEYDGSTEHGVDIDKFAREALKRLDARHNYLTNEIKKQGSIITGFEANDKEKNEAYAKVISINAEVWEIEEMQFLLESASPILEHARNIDHKDINPSILDKYK